MPEAHSELTSMALVILAALFCGMGMRLLRQPAIVGYILAGVMLGPSALELVSDRDAINTLAEFGVLMLLFVVGIELDLRRFVQGWKVAVFTTIIQIGGSVAAALLFRQLMGWSFGLALVLGFAVAVSSTAVVIKILEGSDELHTPVGRTVIGILIAQDIAVVPMMLFLGGLQKKGIVPTDVGKVILSIVFLIVLFWGLGKKQLRLPLTERLSKSQDLGPLAALLWCFGAASLSGLMNLSPAYGAFLAGVIIGSSTQREAVLKHVEPLQSVLLMMFFLSIGLLLDLRFIYNNLRNVFLLLLMVTVFKTALNIGALRLLRQDWTSAFVAGAALAQVGEFSFLLADVGKSVKLITFSETKLVVAVTVLSLVLSPIWLFTLRRLHQVAGGRVTLPAVLGSLCEHEVEVISRGIRRFFPGAATRKKSLPPPSLEETPPPERADA